MGKYDSEVQTILGLTVLTLLCTAASEDKIDGQKMKGISVKLRHEVGGKHRKRGGRSDEAEMREVLSDWYELGGLCDLNRDGALGRLVDTLEDSTVNLRPLAKELRQLMGKGEENQTSLPAAKGDQRTVDSGRRGDCEERVPLTDNQNSRAETSYQAGNIDSEAFHIWTLGCSTKAHFKQTFCLAESPLEIS